MEKNRMVCILYEYPTVSAILLCVIFNLMRHITWTVFNYLPDNLFFELLEEVIGVVWPWGIVALTGFIWMFKAGDYKRTIQGGGLIISISVIILFMSVFSSGGLFFFEKGPALLTVLSYFFVGIREEVILRGICLNLLADKYATSKKGVRLAILLNALMFGLMHLGRLSRGAALSVVVPQVFFTFFLGIMLASMYMYGGNIWAVALAHAIWDIATAAEKGHPSINFALLALVAFVAFIGFPAVSLRLTGEKNYNDIIKRFDRRRNKRKELRVDNYS